MYNEIDSCCGLWTEKVDKSGQVKEWINMKWNKNKFIFKVLIKLWKLCLDKKKKEEKGTWQWILCCDLIWFDLIEKERVRQV